MASFGRQLRNSLAFTLVEVAIVLTLVGLVAGGGVVLVRVLREQKQRNETAEYLAEVRQALLTYANVNGRLPYPDTVGDDGVADNNAADAGNLPYKTLGLRPRDAWSHYLKYQVHPSLVDPVAANVCLSLKNFLKQDASGQTVRANWTLKVWDADATIAGNPIGMSFVVVSGGANGSFDDNYDGATGGKNTTGLPCYLRQKPTNTFDDMVLYLGPATVSYWAGCK